MHPLPTLLLAGLLPLLATSALQAAPPQGRDAPLHAAAEKLPGDEAGEVRAVVQAQLDAFAADDAEAAFRFATPAIQQRFGSAERFLMTVREAYPAVYRPASIFFMTPIRVGDEVVQQVRLVDGDGAVWIAIYTLERQPDQAWRIQGCQLSRSAGRMI